MSALAWALAAAGVLLLWSAVKGEDPRDILAGVFGPAARAAGVNTTAGVGKSGRTVPKG